RWRRGAKTQRRGEEGRRWRWRRTKRRGAKTQRGGGEMVDGWREGRRRRGGGEKMSVDIETEERCLWTLRQWKDVCGHLFTVSMSTDIFSLSQCPQTYLLYLD